MPASETFDVPILTTYADVVVHYNRWAEAERKQYRLREANGSIEMYDPEVTEHEEVKLWTM